MKRTKRVIASHKGTRIEVTIKVDSRDGFTSGEVAYIMQRAVRGTGAMLANLPYISLGIDNTVVR